MPKKQDGGVGGGVSDWISSKETQLTSQGQWFRRNVFFFWELVITKLVLLLLVVAFLQVSIPQSDKSDQPLMRGFDPNNDCSKRNQKKWVTNYVNPCSDVFSMSLIVQVIFRKCEMFFECWFKWFWMLADVYLNEFECWLMFILWKPTSNGPSQALSVATE